jgi:hypothetical protein
MEDMPTPGQGTYQITRTDQGHLLSLSGMPVGASLAVCIIWGFSFLCPSVLWFGDGIFHTSHCLFSIK